MATENSAAGGRGMDTRTRVMGRRHKTYRSHGPPVIIAHVIAARVVACAAQPAAAAEEKGLAAARRRDAGHGPPLRVVDEVCAVHLPRTKAAADGHIGRAVDVRVRLQRPRPEHARGRVHGEPAAAATSAAARAREQVVQRAALEERGRFSVVERHEAAHIHLGAREEVGREPLNGHEVTAARQRRRSPRRRRRGAGPCRPCSRPAGSSRTATRARRTRRRETSPPTTRPTQTRG